MKKSLLALGLSVALMFSVTASAFAGPASSDFTNSTSSDFDKAYTDDDRSFDGMEYDRNAAGRTTNNAIDEQRRVTTDGNTYSDAAKNNYNPHGNFTKNTFACAECHRTHEAAGAKLIRRNSNTNLCFACHDGTSSAYNVVAGKVNGVKNSTAGGFDEYTMPGAAAPADTKTTHSVNPDKAALSAPGGDPAKNWNLECVNCHNPHGQTVVQGTWTGNKIMLDGTTQNITQIGNDRLLESAPVTIMAADDVFAVLEPVGTGDYEAVSGGTIPVTEARKWWRMKEDPRVTNSAIGPTFSRVWKTEQGAARPVLYKVAVDADGKAAAPNPANIVVPANVITVKDPAAPADPSKNFTMVKWDGMIIPEGEVLRAEFRPIMAKPTVMNFANKYMGNEDVTYVANMNTYCSTCHYDYYQNLGGDYSSYDGMGGSTARTATGAYSKAYRHAIGTSGYAWWFVNAGNYLGTNNNMSIENYNATTKAGTVICQSCHYVHGSPTDSLDREKADASVDNSLLKQDNRIVCQACHNKIDNGTDYTPFINESLVNYRK